MDALGPGRKQDTGGTMEGISKEGTQRQEEAFITTRQGENEVKAKVPMKTKDQTMTDPFK